MENKETKKNNWLEWWRRGGKRIVSWMIGFQGWLLWLIAAILLLVFSVIWYQFILHPEWPEDKVNSYQLDIQSKEPSFRESQFKAVTEAREKNQAEAKQKIQNVPEAFQLKSNQ